MATKWPLRLENRATIDDPRTTGGVLRLRLATGLVVEFNRMDQAWLRLAMTAVDPVTGCDCEGEHIEGIAHARIEPGPAI